MATATKPRATTRPGSALETKIQCDLCGRMTPISEMAEYIVLFEGQGDDGEPGERECELCPRCVAGQKKAYGNGPFWAMPCEQCGRRECGAEDYHMTYQGSTPRGGDDPSEYSQLCGFCAPSDTDDFYDDGRDL